MESLLKANHFFREKKYDNAIFHYKKFLNERSGSKEEAFSVYFNLAEAYSKKGDHLSARIFFYKA